MLAANSFFTWRSASGGGDPYWSSVTLSARFDGTNGSTSFPDASLAANTLTAVGTAQLSTTSPKFGSASLSLSGSGAYVTIPGGPWIQVGSAAFTLEMWINKNAGFTNHKRIFSFQNSSISGFFDEGIVIEIEQTTGRIGGAIFVGSTGYSVTDTVAITTGAWVHVQLVYTGSAIYLFKDGALVGSIAASGAVNYNAGWKGCIGRHAGSPSRDFDGRISDVRFTKGVARNTSSFSVPTGFQPQF